MCVRFTLKNLPTLISTLPSVASSERDRSSYLCQRVILFAWLLERHEHRASTTDGTVIFDLFCLFVFSSVRTSPCLITDHIWLHTIADNPPSPRAFIAMGTVLLPEPFVVDLLSQ